MTHYTTPPSEDDILHLAEAALAAMPPALAHHVRNLAIMVEDIADPETLSDLEIDNPWELTGLYRGVPLTERGSDETGQLPDTVYLYRDPILMEWIESDEDLGRLVASVLIHEIAHHFGYTDDQIDRIEEDLDRAQAH